MKTTNPTFLNQALKFERRESLKAGKPEDAVRLAWNENHANQVDGVSLGEKREKLDGSLMKRLNDTFIGTALLGSAAASPVVAGTFGLAAALGGGIGAAAVAIGGGLALVTSAVVAGRLDAARFQSDSVDEIEPAIRDYDGGEVSSISRQELFEAVENGISQVKPRQKRTVEEAQGGLDYLRTIPGKDLDSLMMESVRSGKGQIALRGALGVVPSSFFGGGE